MAVIAIFCDGTWNRIDSADQTHVARLAMACAQNRAQKVLYFEGVGTGTGRISDLGRWVSKVGGGLFGWGLNRNIKAAYMALCRIYQPGDKIMVFGFSRGAYTARSLVGMIRKCGIVADPTEAVVARAFKLYRMRGAKNAPDMPHIQAARRVLSPNFATSAADVMRRNDHSYLVRITDLGVWDKVGALGIPQSLAGPLATLWNRRYRFHDTALSSLVENARHAVALDERRVTFQPSLWDNLDDPQRRGLNRGDRSDTRPYQQQWFSGNHSIVGGSGVPKALTTASLYWITAGAVSLGLALGLDQDRSDVLVDAAAPAPELYKVNRLYSLLPWLLRWRAGPEHARDLHPTARLRSVLAPAYRPKSLRKSLPGLFRVANPH